MALIPLKNLLPHSLERNKISAQIEATRVLAAFNQAAEKKWGTKIHSEAKALYFKNKNLAIAVLSSVVASEIKLNQNYLTTSINESLGYEAVKGFRLII